MMQIGAAQRIILGAWLVLVALSVAAIFAGHAYSVAIPRLVLAGSLLAISFLKASLVLSFYLELRKAPRWNRALHLSLALLLLVLMLLTAFR